MNNRHTFKAMHQQQTLLLLPNAWDLLSAVVLAQSGFKAIGTTSWGVANAMGYKDGEQITFDEVFSLTQKILAAVDIPVTIDMESGYGQSIDKITENVLRIADLGVAGINFEDSLKTSTGLVELSKQGKVLAKIRQTLDQHGHADVFINARIDSYLQLAQPLNDTINRAKAYVDSGADGIFVPALAKASDIACVIDAIKAPLNVMSLANLTDVEMLNKLGVKRFSIGPALSNASINYIEQQSKNILSTQSLASLYNSQEITTRFK